MIGVLISAVTLASIYMLVAAGLSLQWGGLGFLNLAYGFAFAASGYGAYWAATTLSESLPVVLLGGILVGVVVNVLVCLGVVYPLENRPNWPMRSVVAGLAVALHRYESAPRDLGPRPEATASDFRHMVDHHRRHAGACEYGHDDRVRRRRHHDLARAPDPQPIRACACA